MAPVEKENQCLLHEERFPGPTLPLGHYGRSLMPQYLVAELLKEDRSTRLIPMAGETDGISFHQVI